MSEIPKCTIEVDLKDYGPGLYCELPAHGDPTKLLRIGILPEHNAKPLNDKAEAMLAPPTAIDWDRIWQGLRNVDVGEGECNKHARRYIRLWVEKELKEKNVRPLPDPPEADEMLESNPNEVDQAQRDFEQF